MAKVAFDKLTQAERLNRQRQTSNPRTLCLIGDWYAGAVGAVENREYHAATCYRRAASMGDAQGQYKLALAFLSTGGTGQFRKTSPRPLAFALLVKAAAQGHHEANLRLAQFYLEFIGSQQVPRQNLVKAVRILSPYAGRGKATARRREAEAALRTVKQHVGIDEYNQIVAEARVPVVEPKPRRPRGYARSLLAGDGPKTVG